MVHVAGYGAGPLVFFLTWTAFNYLGTLPAIIIENNFTNFHLFEEDREAFMKYSRFPAGIPEQVELSQLIVPEEFYTLISE